MNYHTVTIGEFNRLVIGPHPYSTDPCMIASIERRDGGGWVAEAERVMTPTEVRDLAATLNRMADNIDNRNTD